MLELLSQSKSSLMAAHPADPIVLCAADDHYVKPLAVTLHSAASNLAPGRHLHVILMDGGIRDENYEGLRESLFDLPLTVNVLKIDPQEVADLVTSHHITHTAYFRLLAARLLPAALDKVIYLDSDVLVRDDLTQLWQLDLAGRSCLAAIDIACPYVDAYTAAAECERTKRSIPYLAAVNPIPNWRQLGLEGSQPYFNSGVMVLNLARWRADEVDRQLLRCLRENAPHVWCWDQYALNVVFAGDWGPLPARWNQGAHLYEYPDERHSPIDVESFREMRDNPAVIHFTTEFKPWKFRPYHPLRETFFEQLDQTAWKDWRPERPAFELKRWWDLQAAGWVRRGTIAYRKLRLQYFN